MDEYIESNREMWDGLAELHVNSDFYDLKGFLEGNSTLYDFELAELGVLAGKSLLHLQCHFGLDTLSFARLGAKVTGLDISPKAISLAESIARENAIEARFVCSNIYDAHHHIHEKFDIVYTSAGVLCWLPDLVRWGEIAAKFVKPGGVFFIREFHPLAFMLDDDRPELKYPYFAGSEPIRFENVGSYGDSDDKTLRISYEWPHSLAEITSALSRGGLVIDEMKEYNFTTYRAFKYLTEGADGFWRYDAIPGGIPLMFMIRASLPAR